MKSNCFKLKIKTQDEREILICQKYWEITEEGKYTNSVKKLADEFNITAPEFTKIAKLNSTLEMCCEHCPKKITEFNLRTDLTKKLDKIKFEFLKEFLCLNCTSNKKKREEKIRFRELYKEMELACETEKWKKLNKRELQSLIIISNSKTKKEMFRKLFSEARLNNEKEYNVFNIINKLEELNLIWVERTKDTLTKEIKKIHTIIRLRKKIKITYPDNISLKGTKEQKEKKNILMERAYKNEEWKKLNEMQLETLILIAESNTKSETYHKIFYGADPRGEYAKKIWKNSVNELEELNLIWIERKEDDSIINFQIHKELKQRLKKTYPELFSDENKE